MLRKAFVLLVFTTMFGRALVHAARGHAATATLAAKIA